VNLINASLFSLLLSSAASADVLSVHCPIGCPSNPEKNDLVFGHLYAMSNNPDTKFADWVAYEVDVVNFGDTPGRKWAVDPLLDQNETLEAADYKGASSSSLEADRGHQAPLASFAGSRYWSELNYLSNITPQDKDLNQGPWKNLEEAVRGAVKFRNSLFVMTGPIFSVEMASLPGADEGHTVPSGYFKIIYNEKGESAAFIMQQSAGRKDRYCQAVADLSTVQESVHFELPSALHIEQPMQSRVGC
jgi:endonuclease G